MMVPSIAFLHPAFEIADATYKAATFNKEMGCGLPTVNFSMLDRVTLYEAICNQDSGK